MSRQKKFMSLGLVTVAIIAVAISYQNCAGNKMQAIAGAQGLDNKIVLNVMGDSQNLSMVAINRQVGTAVSQRYEITLATRVIRAPGEPDRVLPEDKLATLLELVGNVEVCEFTQELPPGTVCTQSVQMGYASLAKTNGQFDLGYSPNGCGTPKTDICDEDARRSFESYVTLFLSEVSTYPLAN